MNNAYLKIRFSFLILVFEMQFVWAQHYDIRQYTAADGLPSASVGSVFQDSRDFIWVCAQDGLCRFDGKTFTNIIADEKDSVSNIWVVFEDSIGNLWGNTVTGSYKFDGRNFSNYSFKKRPKNLWVTQQFVTGNKKIWLALSSGIYELQNKVWVKIPFLKNDENVFYNQVVELDDDRLLFNFRDSICIYDKNKNLKRISCNDELLPIFKSTRVFKKEIFLFTNKHAYKFQNDSLLVLYPDYVNGFVHDLYLDKSGKLWIAVNNEGIKVFDYYNSIQKPIDKIVISGGVNCMMQDRNNNMWISSLSGLYKLTPRYVHFISQPQKEICNVFNAGNGNIILGRINGEPFAFKKDSIFPVSQIYNSVGKFEYSGAWMRSLTVDNKQRIWMGNYRGNIYRMDSNGIADLSGRFESHKRMMGGMAYNSSDDAVYLSGDSGIVKVKNDSVVKNFKVFTSIGEYANAMKTDYSGRTWFFTYNQPSNLGYIQNDSVFKIKNFSIKINSPSPFYFDSAGYVYMSTLGQGVFKFHTTTADSIQIDFHFTTKNGFISNFVNTIDFDKSGCMWVASGAGIFSVRMIDSLHYNISKHNLDALTGNTDWFNSDLVFDGDNRIYFSALDGAGYIECDKVIENIIPPKVYINDISIANHKVDWKHYCSSLTPFFFMPVKPVLPHTLNQFIISFTSSCYSDADEIFYCYNIGDNDSSWVFNGKSDNVSLINLAPGYYAFRVRARTANSDWSKEAVFEFVINPPWWRTWLFYGLLLAVVSAGFIFYMKHRNAQFVFKIKTQQQIHELEQRSLRAQMNPHFIFNVLRSINEYIQHNKSSLASEYLVKFSKLMRAILENSRQMNVVLSKEIEVLEAYMQLESQRMEHPFKYSFETDTQIDAANTLMPPMLLQPIVENSIWHGLAPNNRPGKIIIRIKKQGETILCEVEDDGIGRVVSRNINKENLSKPASYGLKITEERLAIIEQMKKIKTNLTFRDLEGTESTTGLIVSFNLPYEEVV